MYAIITKDFYVNFGDNNNWKRSTQKLVTRNLLNKEKGDKMTVFEVNFFQIIQLITSQYNSIKSANYVCSFCQRFISDLENYET